MKKEPVPNEPDDSCLLAIFNPYGLPPGSNFIEEGKKKNSPVVKDILQWLMVAGLEADSIWAKSKACLKIPTYMGENAYGSLMDPKEFAIIVNVRVDDAKSKEAVENMIGMHKWSSFLINCPPRQVDTVAHVYRCTAKSMDYLERVIGTVTLFQTRVVDIRNSATCDLSKTSTLNPSTVIHGLQKTHMEDL